VGVADAQSFFEGIIWDMGVNVCIFEALELDFQVGMCGEVYVGLELEILAGILFDQATLAWLVPDGFSATRERVGGPSAPTSCWLNEHPDITAGVNLLCCEYFQPSSY
jgi:hypothetical protein